MIPYILTKLYFCPNMLDYITPFGKWYPEWMLKLKGRLKLKKSNPIPNKVHAGLFLHIKIVNGISQIDKSLKVRNTAVRYSKGHSVTVTIW